MNASPTDELIHRLGARGAPVRPLAAPWLRGLLWGTGALAYLVVVDWVWMRTTTITLTLDRRFLIEQAAALLTGLTAACAAFTTVVPGRSRRLAWWSLAPLALWLLSVGRQCVQDWSASGVPALLPHWGCFAATVAVGLVPALVIVLMLRRGAPLTPTLTTALAGVAAAGLANFGVRFVHAMDVSFVVLTWHLAAVFALCLLVTRFGDHVFSWRKIPSS